MGRVNQLLVVLERYPVRTILMLLAFHLAVTVTMHVIATSSALSQLHNGHGLWNFASDSFPYHERAITLAAFLEQGDWSSWWHGEQLWQHVKWIALCYWLLGHTPLAFELFNAPVWALTVVAIWMTGRLLFEKEPKLAYVPAVLFGFMPSYLLSTTQLLKDPLYILGLAFLGLGWLLLFKGKKTWLGVIVLLTGLLLAVSMRAYLVKVFCLLFGTGLLVLALMKPASRKAAFVAALIFFSVPPFVSSPIPMPEGSGSSSSPLASEFAAPSVMDKAMMRLDRFAQRIGDLRSEFASYEQCTSNIDTDVRYQGMADIVKYLPRAIQVGLFAPFPNQWFQHGEATGTIGRLIAAAETLVWYVLLMASLYCWWVNREIFSGLSVTIVLSFAVIVLLGLVVTNVGAIYRMRCGYLIPFYIAGVYGLYSYLYKSSPRKE